LVGGLAVADLLLEKNVTDADLVSEKSADLV
jgi:hypothetical protein